MSAVQNKNKISCAVYVDMGTTNTRVWLAHEDRVLAEARATVGVRDTARDGSTKRIRSALRELIAEVRQRAAKIQPSLKPRCVIAAGMITSQLGLVELPHIVAPAGLAQLAAGVARHSFPEITDLPILLVPGVRSGPRHYTAETVGAADVMRGEETLCVGLVALNLLSAGGSLINLGSHWKTIHLDADKRIDSSVTSMGGELVHAAQTQTILASAVPHQRPATLDEKWLDAGASEQRRSGLARTLFCVRLLEQATMSTPEERLAFLIGAFVAADLDALMARRIFISDAPVVITGGGAVAVAWQRALWQKSVPSVILTETQVESALLTGLRYLTSASSAML